MRIAYITAGAAGMYCGSCLHDNTLAAALIELGEDVLLVPTYTPLRTDEPDVSIGRIFFGGINVYLQEKMPLFRRTPWWFDSLFNNPALLERVTRGAASVDPSKLGGMTVSMLRGEAGNQRKEVEKLVHWLIDEVKPDVVHLSNSMQIGMTRTIRQKGGPPVVCQLSGEDLFLEKLPPPYYDEARRHLRERAADVDAFVALNRYYADFMAEYLAVDRAKIHIVPHGLKLEGHAARRTPAERGAASVAVISNSKQRNASQPPALPGFSQGDEATTAPRVIGYLARVCEDKGLHLLIQACENLAARNDLPPFVVHAAGYLGKGDKPYLKRIEAQVARGPLAGRFKYVGELDRAGKIAFLQTLDIFSTPTVYRESKGLPALEAMANAVPVVLPDHGSFSEMIADTGGGLLHRPRDANHLAERLSELLRDPLKATQLGLAGQQAIHNRYHARAMAEQTRALYRLIVDASRKGPLATRMP
jgi:glycosyltransferase involved in cell wall biosynthesis